MYSWEIDNIIKSHDYHLPSSVYFKITNEKDNPQVKFIKYDAWNNNFCISTDDGYSWTVTVYLSI